MQSLRRENENECRFGRGFDALCIFRQPPAPHRHHIGTTSARTPPTLRPLRPLPPAPPRPTRPERPSSASSDRRAKRVRRPRGDIGETRTRRWILGGSRGQQPATPSPGTAKHRSSRARDCVNQGGTRARSRWSLVARLQIAGSRRAAPLPPTRSLALSHFHSVSLSLPGSSLHLLISRINI
jgi:hypothetical protein